MYVQGVQQQPTAWHDSSGDTRSLQARYDDVAAKLRAQGHAPIVPVTEQSLYQMKQQLIALQPVPVHDPARSAACHELDLLCSRYKIAAANIDQLQRWLEHSINDKIHVLLNDIPEGWNRKLRRELPHGIDFQNTTAGAVRAVLTELIPAVLAVEDMRAQLEAAVNVDKRTPPETLIWALYDRTERHTRMLTQQISLLSDKVKALDGKLDRIGRAVKRRRK
jgi:hypothetical protein